jgi:hypothetical protein
LKRIRATIFAVEKQRVLHIVSAVLLYFSTLSKKGTIFEKKVSEHKICVLVSSTTFARKNSHSEKY